MKFGIQLHQRGWTYPQIKEIWLECERLGFDYIFAVDHLNQCLEGWTLISSLASLTTDIRFGLLVTCNSYRHPPLLAKIASTVDIISNGRLEFGIGAGDAPKEYEGYGYPFPKASTRIEQLKEALHIIKKMWTEERPTYRGKYYTIKECENEPRPVQKPHPPIWIGSLTGGKMMSRIAAIHADVYNIGAFRAARTPSTFIEKMEILKENCRLVGRRYEDIERTVMFHFTIARTKSTLKRKLKEDTKQIRVPISVEEYMERSLHGTPENIAERIKEYADVGMQGVVIIFPRTKTIEDLRLFSEVIQQFKDV